MAALKEEAESVAECLRQIVPNRFANVRKRPFAKCFCLYTRADKCSCVICELLTRGLERTEIRVSTECRP